MQLENLRSFDQLSSQIHKFTFLKKCVKFLISNVMVNINLAAPEGMYNNNVITLTNESYYIYMLICYGISISVCTIYFLHYTWLTLQDKWWIFQGDILQYSCTRFARCQYWTNTFISLYGCDRYTNTISVVSSKRKENNKLVDVLDNKCFTNVLCTCSMYMFYVYILCNLSCVNIKQQMKQII